MRILLTCLFLFVTLTVADDTCTCGGEYQVIGPPFKVHGRLSMWNGNPSMRIWIIGTKRMLGIREGTQLPENLEKLLIGFDTEVYGDFTVCHLAPYAEGDMQIVCVQAASNLIVKKRR
ncbi:MAG: hypothetical protein V2A65_03060 [Candidatus Omnitrophota bacterium]